MLCLLRNCIICLQRKHLLLRLFCLILKLMEEHFEARRASVNGGAFVETITMHMEVPEGMAPYLIDEDQEQTFQRNAMFLFSLIQSHRISYGRAAEILGVSKWHLIEFYDNMGMPYLNQSKAELLEELKTYDRLKEQRA